MALFTADQLVAHAVGLDRRDLRAVFGSSARASEIFCRRRALSLNHIRALASHFDMDANILIEWYPLTPPAAMLSASPSPEDTE